eukprot:1391770-Amorphochlora_amoeboformis.AAC.1
MDPPNGVAVPLQPPRRTPPAWKIHGALILAQMLFGGGSVVGKVSIDSSSSLVHLSPAALLYRSRGGEDLRSGCTLI